ncbi:MAG: RNA-directed DNA polymerase, partial [bacterium]
RAVLRLKGFLKNPENIYCLQCDVRKYFESIDHNILMGLIKKKIADKKVLRVIKEIIDSSFDHKTPQKCQLLQKATGTESLTGVPLGNLTSQLFANIYLNELDRFAKHKIKAKYYIRYMDDFLILGYNKKEFCKMKEEIKIFLLAILKLDLHPKKCNIFPVKTGIDFLGYRIFANYRLLRKSTVRRFIKRTKHQQQKRHLLLGANGTEKATGTERADGAEKFFQSIASWLSYAKFGNSWRLRESLKWLWEF